MNFMNRTTLCYPIVDGKVLLAMKKRGFGQGKWNGPGGKCLSDESAEDACRRETKEEIGVDLEGLALIGEMEFIVESKPEWNQRCSIFLARGIKGDPVETEEMKPQWFPLDGVPYEEMWADDVIWLPGALRGESVNLRFYFHEDGSVLRYEALS